MLAQIRLSALCAVLFAAAVAGPAAAECTLSKIADVPVTMAGLRPVVTAQVDGRDVAFLADSGSDFSMIASGLAPLLKLRIDPNQRVEIRAVAGTQQTITGVAQDFSFAGQSFHRVSFILGGAALPQGVYGILGQNVLGVEDVEYDLANRAIRLFRPKGCEKTTLSYWNKTQPYSVVDIRGTNAYAPSFITTATVNGHKIRVKLDTGSDLSKLKLGAAAAAGITPKDPGVTPGGFIVGASNGRVETWIAPIASFKLGDEEVKDTKIRIGDLDLADVDMLLGVDFFLSHRVYVARSQGKLYITYNGGPVFNLERQAGAPDPTAVVAAAPALVHKAVSAADKRRAAEAFAQGQGFEKTRLPQQAMDAFGRAIELDPDNALYLLVRASLRTGMGQEAEAKADLDQALVVKPDYVPVLLLRGGVLLALKDDAGAKADFDRAAALEPFEPNLRLVVARAYFTHARFEAAIGQYDLWVSEHPTDGGMAKALTGRCRSRAMLGKDLDQAMDDCNRALAMTATEYDALESRGVIFLRRGEFDRAIADYDAALRLQPKSAWSLYGRGLAEMKKGMSDQGAADMQAAAVISPKLPASAARVGLTP